MIYRIKIVTEANGEKKYFPYFKKWYGWVGIHWTGVLRSNGDDYFGSREGAKEAIDAHYLKNFTTPTTEFEYITK